MYHYYPHFKNEDRDAEENSKFNNLSRVTQPVRDCTPGWDDGSVGWSVGQGLSLYHMNYRKIAGCWGEAPSLIHSQQHPHTRWSGEGDRIQEVCAYSNI